MISTECISTTARGAVLHTNAPTHLCIIGGQHRLGRCIMLSTSIILTPVLQLMTHARAHQLPQASMHLLMLHSTQSRLMLILYQAIRVLLLVLILLLGLRQLRLVVLILQHSTG